MTRLSRLLPALLLVSLAACAARVTGREEAAPPTVEGEPHREPSSSATSPSGGGEPNAELLDEAVPTLGRAGAEAPSGGLPEENGADIVIDWDRVRRHAASDAEFGVNVKRNDDTGGIRTPAAPPAAEPDETPVLEGAGNPY